MRALILAAVSVTVLSGCLTTQENPNYEFSSKYKGETQETYQYAEGDTSVAAPISYQPATTQAGYAGTTTASTQTIAYDSLPADHPIVSSINGQAVDAPFTGHGLSAPTDTAYVSQDVSGTPGYMAMQAQSVATPTLAASTAMGQTNAQSYAAQSYVAQGYSASPAAVYPVQGQGTPVNYDMSQNLIPVEVDTTNFYPSETVRTIPHVGATMAQPSVIGQSYVVRQGDTVYSLSRQTCVGVNVIQSMNGLSADFGIQIGQVLQLPNSIC